MVKEICDEEGIEGLKDRTKDGRPSELPEQIIYHIKKELKERTQRKNQRMDHKTGGRVNRRE